ncbi:hypothetical protein MA16_Dca004779 [Dendrobium catenatum]|uniref:Uncharacterized protein n=1 Tax=Dendrobium catenatum TaxID=906689 RepID=A0A2I0VP49_9ASPA|nr:hypothetical protein MA16_Dca004779 [Dendrobium catenatum]
MMKKLLEKKTNPTSSEARETTGDHDVGGNPNPLRGRRNPDVEILEGEDDMPPLEPLSREEMSMGNDRRGRREEYDESANFGGRIEEFQRRCAEFQRRCADFERGRGEYDDGFGYHRRREDRETWGAPPLRGMEAGPHGTGSSGLRQDLRLMRRSSGPFTVVCSSFGVRIA